ncbi:MAG TPA: barstar family protein [Xylella sp.]
MNSPHFPLDLGNPKHSSVYRVASSDFPNLAALARAYGLHVTQVDLHHCHDKATLLLHLASQLSFPKSFGQNWDALADALRDLSWLAAPGGQALLLDGMDTLAQQAVETHATLLDILEETTASWANDNQVFVAFVADTH